MNVPIRKARRVSHEIRLRQVQVVRTEAVTPLMRRITLGGASLDGFVSMAADDHVKLFFPAPGEDKPVLPVLGTNGLAFADGAIRPTVRDYTPRRYDDAAQTLTFEFVLHGQGPAASWARQAKPGDWLGVGGPRGSFLAPEDYDTYLLVGDETALPAISRRLEEMPPGVRAIVLIEVADRHEERHLPTAANASIMWLHRDGIPAGTPHLLERALESTVLPDGSVHAWLAGEIETVRSLRRHLVEDRKLSRADIRAAGYWRIGGAGGHTSIED